MKPSPGNHITIVFKNSIKLDGEVIEWNDTNSILKTLEGINTIIVPDHSEILFYKFNSAVKDFETIKSIPHKTEKDLMTLAELRKEKMLIDREQIGEKLSSHTLNSGSAVNYGIPNITFKSPEQHTEQEIPREDNNFTGELSDLFSKK
jgi:hypothetical protein